MRKRKIFWGVVLLLFVNALLLLHDVAMNRVLCYKKNGAVNLEPAFFDFQCACKGQKCLDHDHGSTHPAPDFPRLCAQADSCFDQPVDGSGMERTITPGTPNIHFLKFFDIDVYIYLYLNDGFGSCFASLPLSKFLDPASSEYNHIILRC